MRVKRNEGSNSFPTIDDIQCQMPIDESMSGQIQSGWSNPIAHTALYATIRGNNALYCKLHLISGHLIVICDI